MRGNNVVGVLFSNVHDDKIRELTERRTIASVPFGGRYRLIDFPLSNNLKIHKPSFFLLPPALRVKHLRQSHCWNLGLLHLQLGTYVIYPS